MCISPFPGPTATLLFLLPSLGVSSVCLSLIAFTFACTQMAEDVVKRLLSPGSPQSPRHNSKDNRLNQDVKYMGMGLKKLSAA